jgi:hypothetical protein
MAIWNIRKHLEKEEKNGLSKGSGYCSLIDELLTISYPT